jgi:hypothetical protein
MIIMAALLIASVSAEQRFEAGDPAAALQLLEQAPQPADPVWRYNRAISAHAAGALGVALRDYEWLTMRDSQDDAVRINRLLARLDRGTADDAEPPLGRLARLPIRSLLAIGLVCAVLAIGRRRRADALARWARYAATALSVVILLHHLLLALDSRAVAGRESVLREQPGKASRAVLSVPEGNLLAVEASQGDWVQVRTGSGVRGFVRRSELLTLRVAPR